MSGDSENFLLFGDWGFEENAVNSSTEDAEWHGLGWVTRYQLTDHLEPAVRLEFLHDEDSFASGVDQDLYGVTVTLNYKMSIGKGFNILVRPEYRFDKSTSKFFTDGTAFRSKKKQHTVGIGAYIYF